MDLKAISRRSFFASSVVGTAALYSLLRDGFRLPFPDQGTYRPKRAERVIFLFMSGGPSHVELFDPKPALTARHGEEVPSSIRRRNLLQTSDLTKCTLKGACTDFWRYGNAGTTLSTWLPHLGTVADDIAVVRSAYTDSFNHDTASTFLLTGSGMPGRPASGCWISYGLGSLNRDLPAFVVLLSGSDGSPVTSRYWHNAFLPGKNQGVPFRDRGEPVLYLSNPPGLSSVQRGAQIQAINRLNRLHQPLSNDPEIETRINAYEMAFRMQSKLPGLADIAREPRNVLERYGADPAAKGSFANNCLLARRLAEKGVRFIQLVHRDWDHHRNLREGLVKQCKETDQATAALVADLKLKGLLDTTLIVWAGEFGRTPFCQGGVPDGRDHHPYCFSIWLAGGGIKPGITYGSSDDFGHDVTEHPVHIHDLNATILHCLGIDHERLVYRHQGRDFRLTDTAGQVVHDLLA